MGMNITPDYEDEDSEEEIPETMDVHQESMSKRADRMEQNKQAMLSSFIIEHLRAHMPNFNVFAGLVLRPMCGLAGAVVGTFTAIRVPVRQARSISRRRNTLI